MIDRARARLKPFNSRTKRPGALAGIAPAIIACAILLTAGCRHTSVDTYLSQGDQAMRDSKLTDAESDYQSAIQGAPNDPRTHIALGNLYLFEQKTGPAQLEFMKVLDLDPKNAPAHAALANLYGVQSQPGMAEAHYRAAVVLDPTHVVYRMDLASVLIKENKHGEAEAELRTAIGLDPKNGQAHFALANLLASEPSRAAEAQAEYAQAKALDPRLVPPGAAEASTTPESAATPAASAVTAPASYKVKAVDKKFLLTHDSQVYENPDSSSRVVAHVHKKGFVHVTGIAGDWLQIKMRSGVVGFIPIKTAE